MVAVALELPIVARTDWMKDIEEYRLLVEGVSVHMMEAVLPALAQPLAAALPMEEAHKNTLAAARPVLALH